jgi:hypothetical protein
MRASVILTALYPPPIRERWGNDLIEDVAASGPRSWANTVAGAAMLWARPTTWPESRAGQVRRILLVELTVGAVLAALLLRAAGQPSAVFSADLARPATSAWLAITLFGLAAGAPLPPSRWGELRRMAVVGVRTMAGPACALAAMWPLAHSGLTNHPGALAEILLRCYYWAALGFGGFRLCTLAGRVAHLANPPSARRLATMALLVGLGLTTAAVQNLASRPHLALGSAMLSAGLAGIGVAALATGYDLSHGLRPAKAA